MCANQLIVKSTIGSLSTLHLSSWTVVKRRWRIPKPCGSTEMLIQRALGSFGFRLRMTIGVLNRSTLHLSLVPEQESAKADDEPWIASPNDSRSGFARRLGDASAPLRLPLRAGSGTSACAPAPAPAPMTSRLNTYISAIYKMRPNSFSFDQKGKSRVPTTNDKLINRLHISHI